MKDCIDSSISPTILAKDVQCMDILAEKPIKDWSTQCDSVLEKTKKIDVTSGSCRNRKTNMWTPYRRSRSMCFQYNVSWLERLRHRKGMPRKRNEELQFVMSESRIWLTNHELQLFVSLPWQSFPMPRPFQDEGVVMYFKHILRLLLYGVHMFIFCFCNSWCHIDLLCFGNYSIAWNGTILDRLFNSISVRWTSSAEVEGEIIEILERIQSSMRPVSIAASCFEDNSMLL